MEGRPLRMPLWATNVLVFTCLGCVVVAYFLWEINKVRREYLAHARENALLVAEVVGMSAQGAALSQEVAEGILRTFMGSSARFIDYLDGVEPFAAEELGPFAREAGLAGIRIERPGSVVVEGPGGWLSGDLPLCRAEPGLRHEAALGLYVFFWPSQVPGGCVAVGVSDRDIGVIQRRLGVEAAAERLSQLPGLRYVRLGARWDPGLSGGPKIPVRFLETDEGLVADVRLLSEDRLLSVGMDAKDLTHTLARLWRDFFLFTAGLLVLGYVLSRILYRQQTSHLAEVRAYEERIAMEREAAALGRSAAAIAHEVRNPLNAIGMGLQRLSLEVGGLAEEHRRLLVLMEQAVGRANAAVSGLLRYARPQRPRMGEVRLDRIVEGLLALYRGECDTLGIRVSWEGACEDPVPGDQDLLGEVVENLLRNAVQAQPEGGFLNMRLLREGDTVLFSCTNGGFSLSREEASRILEPYFTTKAAGTGLGLPIARRIVEAHGGGLEVEVPEQGVLEIRVRLPALEGHKERKEG